MANFLLAVLTGLICGAVGLFIAGFVTYRSLSWHRVSAREGAHGYAIIFGSIAGLVIAFILGVILALIFGGDTLALWGKGLGIAMGTTLALGLAILGVSYATSDHPPKIDGRELELELEVRTAPGVVVKPGEDDDKFGAFLYAIRRKMLSPPWRRQLSSRRMEWRLLKAGPDQAEAGCVLACEMPIGSTTRRMLILRLGELPEQIFPMPLPKRPGNADLQWSSWKEAQSGQAAALPAEQRVAVRYRVRAQ